MGVSSIVNRVDLAGNGISTSFPFPYYFFAQSDLTVYIYDTLVGGVTGPLVLNTDYTIVGTQNFQGLYQTGANVVFSTYVPKITDIVVIFRSPIQTQTYSLLTGGTISSTAIVQQFDYLTLLVQRLQDEVTRCVQVPDGVGANFSTQLPSNLAFVPGSSLNVNPTGNGWVLTPSTGGGSGTVTSVGLSMPASIFSVAGSPVVGAGTLTASLATQSANTIFAGPTSGAVATPTFRSIVLADLPVVDVSHGGTGLAAPGVLGNVLTSNGVSWTSSPPGIPGTPIQEVPVGLVNGANVTYSLSFTPLNVANVHLTQNGLILKQGIGLDYTIAGATITMAVAPVLGQSVYALYIH